MAMSVTPRHCDTCGARLAGDNPETTCRPCQHAADEYAEHPPEVPPEFWDHDRLKDALVAERHIGHAVRSWRKHPFWHQPISQEVAARWLSISQTQLSRIENGQPIYDLYRLAQWAKTLQIPPELLWFALPDDGEDVRRRQFLVAGSLTSIGMLSGNSPVHAASSLVNREECIQWLAWELWNRKESALPSTELPPEIRQAFKNIPAAGGIILRDNDDNYSFAHQSLIDFFVAQHVFGGLAQGKSELLATAQTSYDTDQIIRRFVQHQDSCVPTLTRWMREGTTPVLRVNSAGILAKLGNAGISDQVIAVLKDDVDARQLYLTAVASRVFAMPWDSAANLAVARPDDIGSNVAIPARRSAELAVHLGEEVQNSHDGAARWCSIVLLSRICRQTPEAVKAALRETLDREPCSENLRAIGITLTDGDPIRVR